MRGRVSTNADQVGDLEKRGDLDGIHARADAGNKAAAERLAGLLIMQGLSEEAERLRRFGVNPDGTVFLCVKAGPGRY